MAISTPTPAFATVSPESREDPLLDLSQAGEVRRPDGTRRFGSLATLRRAVKNGTLPHELAPDGRKYLVRLSSLELLERADRGDDRAGSALAELELAANRLLAVVGPLSDDQCERIAARLKGVR